MAEMKVYAMKAGIESIKQLKQVITILFSENDTQKVNLKQVSELTAKHSRMISLGMEGKCLKLAVHTKGIEQSKWFKVLFELVEGLQQAKQYVQIAEKN